MCRSGSSEVQGIKRKGKKSSLSFVAEPWSARAGFYLKSIEKLTTQKWSEIHYSAGVYATGIKSNAGDDLFSLFSEQSTDADESEEYEDPRARIVVSDDEPEDEPAAGAAAEVPSLISLHLVI